MVTQEHITRFCETLTDVTNQRYADSGDNVNRVRFAPDKGGKKYTRIVQFSIVLLSSTGKHESPYGSAHCFVKMDDGTLWKPASWKGPAKNFPRGSVFDVPTHEYTGR